MTTAMVPQSTVFVLDDDLDVRDSLRWLFESVDLPVEDFSNGEVFLAEYHSGRPGCLVLDVRMPRMDGLEVLKQLKYLHFCLPTIVITGHGDVPMAVKAMKLGAVEFIQKPLNHQYLLETVRRLLLMDREFRAEFGDPADFHKRFASLTPRELEVMRLLLRGQANKVIAIDMGVSVRTVESHRAQILEKIGVRSVTDLVRISLAAQCIRRSTDFDRII